MRKVKSRQGTWGVPGGTGSTSNLSYFR